MFPSGAFGAEQVLLRETFDDNRRGWLIMSEPAAKARIENGKYRIVFEREGTLHTWINPGIDPAGDFLVEATFRELAEGSPKSGYGLAWGIGGKSDSHLFYIMGKGIFSYGKISGGKWSGSDWNESAHIRKGRAANTLAVRRSRDRVDYLINGTVVATGPFERFFGDNVGFAITGGRQVEIDNLVVKAHVNAKAHAEQHFKRGRELHLAGRHAEALLDFDRAIALNPALDAAYYLKGKALMAIQRPADAIVQFDRTIALHSSADAYVARAEARMSRAQALRSREKHGEADAQSSRVGADLDEAVKLNPNSTRAWSLKAGNHLIRGEQEQGCLAAKQACILGDCRVIEEFSECTEAAPDKEMEQYLDNLFGK
jgi:tetratricopeptide (TPR) repeat protein